MSTADCFIDVDFHQTSKHGQQAAGDVFLSRKINGEDRLVCVLADGLGSGIKANVLATMTATMALTYVTADIDLRRAAEIIMDTLPVCSQRHIGYSTFTIVDVRGGTHARLVEYDNPPYLPLGRPPASKHRVTIRTAQLGERELAFSELDLPVGSRLVLFSDGLTQSGMGTRAMPLGWTHEGVRRHATELIAGDADISARQLARGLVHQARQNDRWQAHDDISCAVISIRQPRRLLVVTGPPFSEERDAEVAQSVREFRGATAICGGTTAKLVARELNRPLKLDLGALDPEIPPTSIMPGIDLVTEGTLTLSRVATLLDEGASPERLPTHGATRLLRLLIDSDCIHFTVGTRINESHQDPSLPVELDIRRNLIKRIARTLADRYLKQTTVSFV